MPPLMSTQNIEAQIAELDNINCATPTAYEEALAAFMKMQRIPFLILELDYPFTVCRTRTHYGENLFKTVSEIAIAPQEAIKYFARCNRPGQSMFYAGENRPTSYVELLRSWAKNKHVGDKVLATISKWEIIQPVNALIISSPHSAERFSLYDLNHGPQLDKFINDYVGDERDAMIRFYEYIFKRFRKDALNDPLTYIITTAYCNLAFAKANDSLDAIFYPSVAYNGQGVNLALKSTFDYSSKMRLHSVSRNELELIAFTPLPNFVEIGIKHAKITGQDLEWN